MAYTSDNDWQTALRHLTANHHEAALYAMLAARQSENRDVIALMDGRAALPAHKTLASKPDERSPLAALYYWLGCGVKQDRALAKRCVKQLIAAKDGSLLARVVVLLHFMHNPNRSFWDERLHAMRTWLENLEGLTREDKASTLFGFYHQLIGHVCLNRYIHHSGLHACAASATLHIQQGIVHCRLAMDNNALAAVSTLAGIFTSPFVENASSIYLALESLPSDLLLTLLPKSKVSERRLGEPLPAVAARLKDRLSAIRYQRLWSHSPPPMGLALLESQPRLSGALRQCVSDGVASALLTKAAIEPDEKEQRQLISLACQRTEGGFGYYRHVCDELLMYFIASQKTQQASLPIKALPVVRASLRVSANDLRGFMQQERQQVLGRCFSLYLSHRVPRCKLYIGALLEIVVILSRQNVEHDFSRPFIEQLNQYFEAPINKALLPVIANDAANIATFCQACIRYLDAPHDFVLAKKQCLDRYARKQLPRWFEHYNTLHCAVRSIKWWFSMPQGVKQIDAALVKMQLLMHSSKGINVKGITAKNLDELIRLSQQIKTLGRTHIARYSRIDLANPRHRLYQTAALLPTLPSVVARVLGADLVDESLPGARQERQASGHTG